MRDPAARRPEHAGDEHLLLSRRRRSHAALLLTVLLVSAFGYVLLQPRNVQVLADGRLITFKTHQSSDTAVLAAAEVDLKPGDRLTALKGEAGTDVLRVDRARSVLLVADGRTVEVTTHASTIDQALDEAGVAIDDRDSVMLNGALVPLTAPLESIPALVTARAANPSDANGRGAAALTLEVRRAVTFTIAERGREVVSTTSRPTVAQALREAGVVVGPGDRVTPGMDEAVTADARIEIAHAQAVTLALPSDHRVIYTFATTVADVLNEAGIALPHGAFVHPPMDTLVSDGMSVRVVQLSASNDVEVEYMESRTVYKLDPSLGPGETRTVAGRDGAIVRRYNVSYVDGIEAGRELIEERYDPEPLDTVVYYPPQNSARADEAPTEGIAQTLHVYATYYTPESAGRPPTDPNYGVTATGVQVTYGIVAVDPNVIPLGTRMYIPGYGYAVAADTGGAVKGYIIDLGYPDGVSVDWRSGWIDIYILS